MLINSKPQNLNDSLHYPQFPQMILIATALGVFINYSVNDFIILLN